MANDNLNNHVDELANKIKNIRLTELSALQTSNNQKILADLQIRAGELSKAVHTNEDKNKVLEAHDELVQAVDTAGVVGLISSDELTEYYKLLDDIWAAIEKE